MKKAKFSRTMVCVLAVLLTVLVSVGCEKKSGDTSASGEGSGSFKGIELVYSSCWNEAEPSANWLKQIAKEWEAATGGRIRFNFIGRDILTQIKTQVLSGNAPDIIDQDASEMQAAFLTDEILLQPINDVLNSMAQSDSAPLSDKLTSAYKMYTQNGNDYFIPFMFVTAGFFYDKTMFAKHNLTPPKTWEDFIKVCATLKAANIPPIALDGNISFYNAYYYTWAVQRVMGSGKLWTAASDTTGAAWDEPGYLEAAKLIYELSKGGKNYFQSGYEGSAYPTGQSEWAQGKYGMVFCGTWIPIETLPQIDDDFEYGFFSFPAISGGRGSGTEIEVQIMSCAIPRDAKNPAAAKDFLRFLSSKKSADACVTITSNISARSDAIYPDPLQDVKPIIDSSTGYFKNYDGVMGGLPEWWANVFYPADNALVFGTATPEQFIRQIKSESIKYWANKK
jgi:raffinose/stachyose/melibiose transport system substrate-binding protein